MQSVSQAGRQAADLGGNSMVDGRVVGRQDQGAASPSGGRVGIGKTPSRGNTGSQREDVFPREDAFPREGAIPSGGRLPSGGRVGIGKTPSRGMTFGECQIGQSMSACAHSYRCLQQC